MRLTANNSDETIAAFLTSRQGIGRFYDPKLGVVFDASPCECCGTMAAHGGDIKIDRVSNRLNRALHGYFTVLDFVETTDYNDDRELECEAC